MLVFVDGGIPERDATGGGGGFGAQPAADTIPAEFRDWLGRVTVSKTVPELKKFVDNGGTIVTIGSSTALGYHLGLPIRNALVETVNGVTRELPREKFYVPGSILEARIDNTQPLAFGMDSRALVFYDESPAFRLLPEAAAQGRDADCLVRLARRRFAAAGRGDSSTSIRPCRSSKRRSGKGHVVLFGNEVLWRAQPHGTFKMFFNSLYYGSATPQSGNGVRTTEQR